MMTVHSRIAGRISEVAPETRASQALLATLTVVMVGLFAVAFLLVAH